MKPYLFVFFAAILWGLIGTLSKGILEAGVAPLEIAFWRALIAGGMFFVHAALVGKLKLQQRGDAVVFAFFALFGVTLFYGSFTLAVSFGGVNLATILLYTAPAFVALAAWALLRERMTPRKLALVGLTILGVILVSGGGGEGMRVTGSSLLWGLVAGFSYAGYYIFGKWILTRYEPVAIYAFILPLGALGLLPLVEFSAKDPPVWGLLALLSVVSTYLAYLLYYTGLKRIEASRAVLIASIEPVVAATLAALVFGERFSPLGLVGAALVLFASILASLPEKESNELICRS